MEIQFETKYKLYLGNLCGFENHKYSFSYSIPGQFKIYVCMSCEVEKIALTTPLKPHRVIKLL